MKKFTLNSSDEELDNLFREAAEGYAPELNKEDAWKKLEPRLGNGSRRRRVIGWWPLLLLLGLLTAGYFIYYAPSQNNIVANKNAKNKSTTAVQNNTAIIQDNTPSSSENNNANSGNNISRKQNNIAGINAPEKNIISSNQSTKVSSKITDGQKQKSAYSSAMDKLKNNEENERNERNEENGGNGNINNGNVDNNIAADQNQSLTNWEYLTGNRILFLPIANNNTLFAANDNLLEQLKEKNNIAQDSINNAAKKKNKQAGNSRFSVRLLAGPDFGTVKFSQWTKPGIDAGLMFGYHFAPRWTVETGVLFSTKIYVSEPKYYNPKTPIRYQDKLKEIDANCFVIDVPVNIRFDVFQSAKNNFFVSTGLSSFWMKKEDYDFEYKTPWTNMDWASYIKNKNRHLFSVWNFKVGYEKILSPHLSLQAEPYLKLPLSGIGYGRVKLISTGTVISVKYNF